MSKPQILVIEDEKFVIDSIERFLTSSGYEVHKAMTRQEAVEALDAQPYHLIITDIMLPHLGGFDIIDYVRSKEDIKATPILISSGMDREIFEMTRNYADDYLAKPYDIEDLLTKVKDLISPPPAA